MRALLEVYRWVTLGMFLISGAALLVPFIVFFMPGYHLDIAPGLGYLGVIMIGMTFAASGFNVIAIAIYDQLRDATTEIGYARTELAYLREEMRDRV